MKATLFVTVPFALGCYIGALALLWFIITWQAGEFLLLSIVMTLFAFGIASMFTYMSITIYRGDS